MQLDPLLSILSLAILILSAVVHEVSHGYAAFLLGDPTAKYQGRLTLNPIKHLDLFGSVIVPILLYFTTGTFFGWAKPVPYNPYNLRDQRYGELKVALAGPASNFIIAALAGLAIRLLITGNGGNEIIISILGAIVGINLILGLFNLIPVPPLDGSKVLFAFLPYKMQAFRRQFEMYGMIVVLFVAYFGFSLLYPFINVLFTLFTGIR